jgi:hypothetical protein
MADIENERPLPIDKALLSKKGATTAESINVSLNDL